MEISKEMIAGIHPFDLIFIAIIFIFAIRGIFKGFIEIILNTLALFGGLILGWLFYRPVATFIVKIGIDKGKYLISFLAIFILFYLLIKVIEAFTLKITENRSLNNLDRALGFFLGAIQGIAIMVVFVIASVLLITSFYDISQFYKGSISYDLIEKFFSSLLKEGGFSV